MAFRCVLFVTRTVLLAAVLFAAASSSGTTGSSEGKHLVQLSVLHRHGARTEPVVDGTNLDWNNCVLSSEGVIMVINLGKFLREKYGSFVPDVFDMETTNANATLMERTVRSTVGVLRGLFNSTAKTPPFVAHVPGDDDLTLAYYYSWPAARLRDAFINGYNMRSNAATLEIFNKSELHTIGTLLKCEQICDTEPTTCALLAQDVVTCRISNNGGVPAQLIEYLPRLKVVQAKSNAFLYLYNHSNPYWAQTGPYARRLLDVIFANSRKALRNESTVKIHIYGAHDITLYGFFVATGTINSSMSDIDVLVPPFASAAFVELWSDGSMKLKYALCDQQHGGNHTFHEVPVQFGCKDGDRIYYSEECPIDHVEQFLDTMKPLSPHPPCTALETDLEAANCQTTNTSTRLTDPGCLIWRTHCPEFACKPPLVLNISDFSCVEMEIKKTQIQQVSATMTAVVISSAVASLIIGLLVGIAVRRWVIGRKSSA